MITDEEADYAIELLTKYCKEQHCKDCRFHKYYRCGIIVLFLFTNDLHSSTKEETYDYR